MKDKEYPKSHAGKSGDNKRMMEGVYAGPDFFAQQNPQMFQTVYAGPDFYSQQPPQMFQTVYAGPDYYTQPNAQPIGAPAPTQTNVKPQKWCPECSRTIDADAKFCPNCGAAQPVVPNDRNRCSGCGAVLSANDKFCPECGLPQPRGDA